MLPVKIILLMLFAAYQAGNMPQLQGLKRFKMMSPELRRYFLRNLANDPAKITPMQYMHLKKRRFRVVVYAKFLGKQSWQDHPITIPVQLLWHLMTIGIPRQIKLKPIDIPPVRSQYMHQLFSIIPLDSVICDSSGAQWKVGSAYQLSIGILTIDRITRGIVQMTAHPTRRFIAMICNHGNVSIGNSDDPNYLMRLIYDAKFIQNARARCFGFHPSDLVIAIGFLGGVNIIRFSENLDFVENIQRIPFVGLLCFFHSSPVTLLVNMINWYPDGTFLTIISHPNSFGVSLTKAFGLDDDFKVKSETTNFAIPSSSSVGMEIPSYQGSRCLCFSSCGKFAVTSDRYGWIYFWRVTNQGNEITFEILKCECVGENWCIKKIKFHPSDNSILAIQMSKMNPSWSSDTLYMAKISSEKFRIFQNFDFPATNFEFHGDCLLIQGRNQIKLCGLNSDNILVEMTDFRLQTGEFESCLLVTVNGNVKLCYTIKGSPQLHTVEVEFK
jgi:hypothetical protein